MKEDKILMGKGVFNTKVIIRKEGDEYLLYNRKNDRVYILSSKGHRALEYFIEFRDIKKTASEYSKALKVKDEEAVKVISTLLYLLKEAGVLSEELKTHPEVEAIPPKHIEKERVEEFRPIGELSLMAWPIAAKTSELYQGE